MSFEVLSGTKKESLERSVVEAAIEQALTEVRELKSRIQPQNKEQLEAFKLSPQAKEKLAFHNEEHTRSVVNRFRKIVEVLRNTGVEIDERDARIGEIGAAFHDVVQDFEENRKVESAGPFAGMEKVLRKRAIGQNESASAEQAIAYMREVNEEIPGTFSFEDEQVVRGAIDVTVPGFDNEKKAVIQPNLSQFSHTIDVVLALADLGTAGMEGPEKFLTEGDAVFREENLDIQEAIYGLARGVPIPEKNKDYFRSRMIEWSKSQLRFVLSRKALLETDLAAFPEETQQAIKSQLFTRFDENLAALEERSKRRETMSFETLAKDMSYEK